MSIHEEEFDTPRREFLRTAAMTTMAAAATGIGATVLARRTTAVAPPVPIAPVTVSPATQAVLSSPDDLAELFRKLAAAQAENMRLQAELDAAQRSLQAMQATDGSQSAQAEALAAELAKKNEQISVLGGLVGLYEQLDDVDVSALVEEGLTAMSASLEGLVSKSPLLVEGVAAGQQALAELEGHIPLLENGRGWLESHQNRLQTYFSALEELLADAVEKVGPFLEMVNQWFQDLRKWLPFNLGERAATVMEAATNLLNETPHTISGLATNVAEPLDLWLAKDGDDVRLSRQIIKPIREQVLDQAQIVAAETTQVQTTYQERLLAPWETAVSQRRLVQDLITQYRQEHQV
ncbi:MAG: hypothetical protein H6659_10380 [Ardenticatenaceae bacterium]|nr:hypothetical protein [Ardenticatenaceae bacterium]